MTELRSEPGERLIDIRRNGESFLITKNGKPVAQLTAPEESVITPEGKIYGNVHFIGALGAIRGKGVY